MTKKQKYNLIRIIIACIATAALYVAPVSGVLRFSAYMAVYLIIGYDILYAAFNGIKNLQPLDEGLLMSIATIGAIAIAIVDKSSDYNEAIAVMLFYQIGEWFQSYAVGKSRKSISDLIDIMPEYANVEKDGAVIKLDPEEIEKGTVIVVMSGEKIPIDGVIVEGSSTLDTAALTGESLPKNVSTGDEVISGCINLSSVIRIKTTKDFEDSTVSKILELIEDASSRKSKSEDFISKFARIYTPAVVLSALIIGFAVPALLMLTGNAYDFSTWIYRALTFLVISCPCALVVSIPMSFFAGIGTASRLGILIKGSNYMETLSRVDTVVFDKTGTLTKADFEVSKINAVDIEEKELLHIAAHAERYSNHPIAESIRSAYENEADGCSIENVEEISGKGMRAFVNGKEVLAGNGRLMESNGISFYEESEAGSVVHVALDKKYAGHVVISDVLKENSKKAVSELKRMNVANIVMLTGDIKKVAEAVGKELGITKVYGELLPQDKVSIVEELLKEKENTDKKLAFVGDGINDAPVLSRADIGIAMGALGSDAAIEAADIVLMDDDPLKLPTAIRISKKCLKIVKENIWFAIGVKLICLILGGFGIANMWLAIFADVGVMVIAVLNAIRCMFIDE